MTALRSAGRAEAFADRRTAVGVIATLGLPVGLLSFLAHASFGQAGVALLASPQAVVVIVVAAGFLFAVSNSAFAAATLRRRARYDLLASVGAKPSHISRLLLWEMGLPAAIGIGLGALTGVVTAEIVGLFDSELDPGVSSGLTGTASGLVATAIIVGIPAIAGVWAAAVASAARVGEPRGSAHEVPELNVASMRRVGLAALAISTPLLLVSVIAFSFTFRFPFLEQFSQQAWLGLIIGVLGALAGVALLIPSILAFLAERVTSGGVASAIKGLAENPRRATGFTAAVLALTTLTVMAAAGILSDADQEDDAGDRRQIVATEFGALHGFVDEVAQRHGNPVVGIARFSSLGGTFFAPEFVGEIATSTFDVAPLTDDLISVLEFSADDVEFARQGGLLIDSDIVDEVVALTEPEDGQSFGTTPVEIRRVRRGGGVGQPGPAAYAFFDEQLPMAGGFKFFLVRFEEPLTDAMIDEFWSSASISSLPRDPGFGFIGELLLASVAVLLFTLAISSSTLAAVEQDEEFSTLVALGASPNVRPKTLALQLAWHLGLGVAVGSGLGVLLFWVVTRGDPSVPNAIVPVEAIGALSVAALAAVALVGLLHGPAEPAVSSRVSATVEV